MASRVQIFESDAGSPEVELVAQRRSRAHPFGLSAGPGTGDGPRIRNPVRRKAAVDEERVPRDVRRARAGEEHGRPREIGGKAVAPDHRPRREGRDLVPSAKARQLMTLLSGLGVNELTSPELTGEWEHQLKLIEQRQLDRESFMREIAQMTQVIVKRAKEYERDTVPGDYATLQTPCPKCGSVVKENYRRYACTACDFSIGKHPGGRTFEVPEVEELLAQRTLGPLTGFISKMGRPFAAVLRITDEYKLEFDFGQRDDEDAEPVDFSGHSPLGTCPKCGGRVFEHGMNYVCERAVGPEKSCTFRSGKVILQQEIPAAQMSKLLETGKTDLLDGFVSSRTNRKFKAFLVRQDDGKVGFEFEPRPAKAGAKTAAAGKTATKTATKSTAKTASKTAAKSATRTATKTAAKKTAVKKTAVKKTAAKKVAAAQDDDGPAF